MSQKSAETYDRDRYRESLELMISAVKDYAIFLLDPDGRIRSWNEGAERINGYRSEEIIGKHFSIFYSSEDLKFHKPERELAIARKYGKYEEEGVRVRKDGSRFWASVTITALFDEKGALKGFGKVTRDITERKKSELALRSFSEQLENQVKERTLALNASEHFLQLVMDSLPAFVAYINKEEKYEFVNHAYEIAFNAKKSKFLGKTMRDALGDTTYRSLEHYIKRALSGERVEFEIRVVIGGHGKALRGSYIPDLRPDGSVRGFVILSHDITRMKTIEQDLLRALENERVAREQMTLANSRLRFLTEASTRFLATLDYQTTLRETVDLAVPVIADGCAIDLPSAEGNIARIAVKHVDPAKVKLAWKLNELYPPKHDQAEGIGKVLREGKAELRTDIGETFLRAFSYDEKHFQLLKSMGLKSVIIAPLIARGKILGAFTLILSESARKFTREDLFMAEELGRRAGLAIDNARLFEQATEAVRARDEFISIASHELKTPLTSMGIQLQLLERAFVKDKIYSPSVRKSVDVLLRQTDRLNRMVNDMLDISRLTTGRLTLEKEEVDLGALIEEIVFRFQSAFDAAHSEPIVWIERKLTGTWDRMRLDQVLSNLVSNAIKYAPEHPIEIRAQEMRGRAVISVRDYGPGIPEEAQERIFQRFERAVPHSAISGLGLGLYISRQIVELHGGTIRVASTPGQGANFIVELPLRAEAGAAAA